MRLSYLSGRLSLPAVDLEHAQVAKKMITDDFEAYHTVEELAKKLGTAEARLQAAFKYLFGQNVAAFLRQATLAQGYNLLKLTTYPLRVVCEMVGYADPSNFSAAFKKPYVFWPGQIQMKANC